MILTMTSLIVFVITLTTSILPVYGLLAGTRTSHSLNVVNTAHSDSFNTNHDVKNLRASNFNSLSLSQIGTNIPIKTDISPAPSLVSLFLESRFGLDTTTNSTMSSNALEQLRNQQWQTAYTKLEKRLVTSASTSVDGMISLFQENPIMFMASVGNYVLSPHEDFVLFRESDIPSWIGFSILFVFLILMDNVYIFRENRILSMRESLKYVIFYLLIALAFAVHIYIFRGHESASNWITGYILEWLLSVDNLFVFRMVFDIYGTPDELKHKPLFYGIVGAIFFRMCFFVIGEALIHTLHYMHIVFGGFLIYTGLKISWEDEEDGDEDPSQHPMVIWLSNHIPMVQGYDNKGLFFVRVKRNPDGSLEFPRETSDTGGTEDAETGNTTGNGGGNGNGGNGNGGNGNVKVWESQWYTTPRTDENGSGKLTPRTAKMYGKPTSDGEPQYDWRCTNNSTGEPQYDRRCTNYSTGEPQYDWHCTNNSTGETQYEWRCTNNSTGEPQYEWRCTFLFIVVICLEITDLMFAVDSVSAIVAQIPDLYLAYTACIFAMLGLRATFFVIDELMRMFTYLKYAVAFMLVFIGVKLVISKVVHIPSLLVCVVLVGTLSICVALSICKEREKSAKKQASKDAEANTPGTMSGSLLAAQ